MTVKELIDKLKDVPGDYDVYLTYSYSMDATGQAGASEVNVVPQGKCIYIE